MKKVNGVPRKLDLKKSVVSSLIGQEMRFVNGGGGPVVVNGTAGGGTGGSVVIKGIPPVEDSKKTCATCNSALIVCTVGGETVEA